MKLSELLKAIQPVQIIGSTEKDITGVNIDSRLVAAGPTVTHISLPPLKKAL